MRTTPHPIRLSTVTSYIRHNPTYRCDAFLSDCGVSVFVAYVDPDEPAYCPLCGRQGAEVVE